MRFFERPDTPAQAYAGAAGLFLVALGVLSLVFTSVGFDDVGAIADQPDFLIWAVSGWTVVFWIAVGAIGLLAVPSLVTARAFALVAGLLFAVLAIWGFMDGNDISGWLVADSAANFTYAVLSILGLFAAMIPGESQRAPGDAERQRSFERQISDRDTAGRW
jgi:hypothetical protein